MSTLTVLREVFRDLLTHAEDHLFYLLVLPLRSLELHIDRIIDRIFHERSDDQSGNPVRMRHGTLHRRLSLLALEEHPRLFRVLDKNERDVELAGIGVTISKKLGEVLSLNIGDEVTVELMEGRRGRHAMRVAAIFPDYTDPGAYVNLRELHRLLAEGERYFRCFRAGRPESDVAAVR